MKSARKHHLFYNRVEHGQHPTLRDWFTSFMLSKMRKSKISSKRKRPVIKNKVMIKKDLCGECRRQAHVGENVVELREGVLGFRDFVSLTDPILFCDLECLRKYLKEEDQTTLDQRIS